jgi:pyruvate/2-oxoglutarate dehydrogenase complex dihydrolipoamide acyltransferase (E2) component
MRSPILMPDVGDEVPALNLWFAQPGDQVYAGDRLVEILLDGATFDVSSPVNGRLAEKTARPGDHLAPGQVLGWIEKDQ